MEKYDQELIEELPVELSSLLNMELKSGNKVVEVAGGWPAKKVNVWLRDPFKMNYLEMFPNLEYRKVNDPHYWRDEYFDKDNQAFIATRY